ncbi:MAG: hypothetical protein R2849_16885 [Thermomicrobiales bacterium]
MSERSMPASRSSAETGAPQYAVASDAAESSLMSGHCSWRVGMPMSSTPAELASGILRIMPELTSADSSALAAMIWASVTSYSAAISASVSPAWTR